jgi:hypothetical protein
VTSNVHVLLLLSASAVCNGATLTADTNRPGTSTFVAGEAAVVSFVVAELAPHQHALLDICVLDEYGKPGVASMSAELIADDHGSAEYSVPMPTLRQGYYEVHAALADGTALPAVGTRPAGFVSYAVVPDPAARPDFGDSGSRFGMQGGFNASANVIFYLGTRYFLQDGAGWGALEHDYPGQYPVERREARSRGLLLPAPNPAVHTPLYNGRPWNTYSISMITRASLPFWALRPDTSGKECPSFGALNASGEKSLPAFATAAAAGFRADYASQHTRYYQVSWEPAYSWCFRGSAADLVQIYALVYAAIHDADPGAIVAGPTLFADADSTEQLRALWKAGLGHYIDALSTHPYVKWPPETTGALATTLRQQLGEATQAAGHPLILIGTEHGYTSVSQGNLTKALGDIRTTLTMLGEGARIDFGFYIADYWDGPDPANDKGYGYYWNLDTRIDWGTGKLGPKIVVPAYAAMTWFLDGTESDGVAKDLSGSQVGYQFHRSGGGVIRALWDPQGSSPYALASGARVCDWMGNCAARTESNSTILLGQAPTYVLYEH